MKNLTRALSLILVLTVCIVPMIITASASAVTAYDYSKDGSYFNTEKNTADLVEIITGEKLSEAEYNYLREYGELSVKYEEVTSQHVRLTVFDGGILVTADEYSYVGKEGKQALWTPKLATVDGISAEFTKSGDKSYTATLDGIEATEGTLVGVEYELTVNGGGFVFAKEDVNKALNLAYNNKSVIKAEYEDAVAKKTAYDEYYAANKSEVDTYHSNLEAYNKYLLDKKLYDAKLDAYNEYLDDVAAFEAAELTYAEYLVKKGAYDAVVLENYNLEQAYNLELREYNESYVKKLNVIKEQIETLDTALYTKVTALERQLYGAIFATLVDQVVENKDLFVSVLGADPDVVDACGVATGILRGILGEYKKLKTEKDKYEFYIQNYDSLRDNIILLTRSLENLYKSRSIRATMHDQGKTEKFVIFVSQLILFANTLTDGDIYDYTNSYKLNKDTTIKYLVGEGSTNYVTHSVIKILENNEYIKDTGNAKPLDGGYPAYRAEPKEPEYKPLPANPGYMPEPIAPDEVENPGNAPTVVDNPKKPEELAKKELTDAIITTASNTVYRDIVNNYALITERAEELADFIFKPTKTVTKSAISQNAVNVRFMDNDGNEIMTVTVEKNDSISFMGDLPVKPSDIEADYAFDFWMDSEGNEFDFSSVSEDVILYPSYKTIYKNYDHAYNVNGNPYLHVDLSGSALGTVPLKHFISVAENNSTGILLTADNAVVRIALADVTKLSDAGVTTLDTAIDTSRSSAYTFSFLLKNAENVTVDTSAALYVQIPTADSEFATSSTLSYTDADGKSRGVNKDYQNGAVSFKAKANVPYLMCVRRAVSAMVGSGVLFEGNVTNVIPGETVTIVPIEPPVGKLVQYTYTYTDASGNASVAVIEGNSFVMPNYAVSVGMTLIDIKYTVTFISDGKVISSNNLYTYGQKLDKPRDPVKQNDADYSYKFIGWSPELSDSVTGDVTYVAQYEKTAIIREEKKGPQIAEKYLKLIRLAIVAAVVFVVLVAGGIVLIIVLRRKKRMAEELPEETADTHRELTEAPIDAESPESENEQGGERVDFENGENGGK